MQGTAQPSVEWYTYMHGSLHVIQFRDHVLQGQDVDYMPSLLIGCCTPAVHLHAGCIALSIVPEEYSGFRVWHTWFVARCSYRQLCSSTATCMT